MVIFVLVDENKTLLPFTVPDTDILHALQQFQFDPVALEEEVSVTYIPGVLDMYRDAIVGDKTGYSPIDIIEKLLHTNFPPTIDRDQTRARISSCPWYRTLSPPKIPWALYELVAETVRVELSKIEALRDYTTPTMFPFLLGVYSMVSHPILVAQSRVQSIEGLI